MFYDILQAAVLFLFPALAIYGARRSRFLEWVSPVVMCYGVGIAMANIPWLGLNLKLSNSMTEITVAVAIPLLLFSTDFVSWLRLAGKTILSFMLGVFAVCISASAGAWYFRGEFPEFNKAAGMLIGVYTGGTGNMTAIGKALEVSDGIFILLNIADVAICSFYLLFLMTFAQKVLLLFLPPFKKTNQTDGEECFIDPSPFTQMKLQRQIVHVAFGVLLSAAVVAFSMGLSKVLFGDIDAAAVIIALTTLAIAASFVPRIRNWEGTYESGNYLLLVFCVAIGTLANVDKLASAIGPIFYITLIAVVGAIVIHFGLAAIFRIDADTVIITSTAAVFSPAFVGPIAQVLRNKEICVSGITTGVIGFAIGNYAGLAVAYLLGWLAGG